MELISRLVSLQFRHGFRPVGPLKRVGENLYVNGHGVYFAWFSLRGKQIKWSLRTDDKAPARRRLANLREMASRLHGKEQQPIQFDELAADQWLASIHAKAMASTHLRRSVCLNQIETFFKGVPVRSISVHEVEKWKMARSGAIAARTFNKELEMLNHVLSRFSGSDEDKMLQSHFYVFYALGKLLYGRRDQARVDCQPWRVGCGQD